MGELIRERSVSYRSSTDSLKASTIWGYNLDVEGTFESISNIELEDPIAGIVVQVKIKVSNLFKTNLYFEVLY